MNRKGFTLIEIITCIILIASISITSIVLIKNSNNDIDKDLSKKILDAANIFIEVEKDENGNNYLEEIIKGAKGVKVPISTLVDKGYIDKNIETELYKTTTKPKDGSYYIMFLNNGENYCKDDSDITAVASWMYDNKPIYLCNNYENNFNQIEYIQNNVKLKFSKDKFAVSEDFKNSLSNSTNYTSDENGIFMFRHNITEGDFLYTFYRGAVDNNYLKLGKDSDGNDLIWRIVWLRDDNKMKIVLDKTIPVNITNKNGQTLDITGKTLYKFDYDYYADPKEFIFLTSELNKTKTSDGSTIEYYDLILPENYWWVNNFNDYNGGTVYNNANFYMKKMFEWYNNTDLKDLNKYDFITSENNFCYNYAYDDNGISLNYSPSENFDCDSGNTDSSSYKAYKNPFRYYSSPVGFLTYGDCIMAGILSGGNNLANSGNYLINSTNSFVIQDLSQQREGDYKNEKYWNYFVNNSGIQISESFNCYTTTKPSHRYKIFDSTGNVLLNLFNNGMNQYYIYSYKFFANSIKPAIIIDLTNYKLSNNSGTINDYYTIVAK